MGIPLLLSQTPSLLVTLNADHGGIDIVGVVTCRIRATLVNLRESNNLGNTGTVATIDIVDGTYVTATLNDIATITLTDPPCNCMLL